MARSGSRQASPLRRIPAVSSLLEREEVLSLMRRYSRSFITDLVREAVEDLRRDVAAGRAGASEVERFDEDLPARLQEAISRRFGGRIASVINAGGVIVHTNLGRSPWSKEAIARAAAAAAGYCDLEYDLEEGGRGSRQEHVESLLGRLFPETRGVAVNNNAGAVMLALNTLADGREVLISRGELVEIGGSFRIPDVMAKSGAVLHEVGTTNRTRLSDFETAFSERTGLLLKVHTSNYRIIGFTEEATLRDLAALGRRRGLPVLVDQGSGCLLDLSSYGLKDEPTVAALLEQGADVVTFSGDKLLGGPQAGLLVGRTDLIEKMKKNPLYRALRPDKVTIAALEGTLESFVAGNPLEEIPTLRMIVGPASEIRARAEALAGRLMARCAATGDAEAGSSPGRLPASHRPARGAGSPARDPSAGPRPQAGPAPLEWRVEEGVSRVGGGAAPMEEIPTALLALRPREITAEAYEAALRRGHPPVVARVREGWLLLDLRTIPPEQEADLAEVLLGALPA